MPPPPVREAFGLQILTPRHPHIRRLKRAHPGAELHGNKLWNASLVLIDYLSEFPLQEGARVLELGCGWGLAGIWCARALGASVVALDADEGVFPFLECQATANGVEVDTIQLRFEDISAGDLAQFDAIIATDVCFWDAQVPVLRDLLAAALEEGVPRVVLADPGRPSFRALADEVCRWPGIDCRYSDWAVAEPHNLWGLVLDLC